MSLICYLQVPAGTGVTRVVYRSEMNLAGLRVPAMRFRCCPELRLALMIELASLPIVSPLFPDKRTRISRE